MSFVEHSPVTKNSNKWIKNVIKKPITVIKIYQRKRKSHKESQKSLKCKIITYEIDALKEKRRKCIEMLCLDASLKAVIAEKLQAFCYLLQLNQHKNLPNEKQEEVIGQKNGRKTKQDVLKK